MCYCASWKPRSAIIFASRSANLISWYIVLTLSLVLYFLTPFQDITNLITRRVNYMIALYAKHVLPTDIRYFTRPMFPVSTNRVISYLSDRSVPYFGEYHFLPLMLQWSIDYVLKRCIFDSFGNIRLKVLDKGKESHEVEPCNPTILLMLNRHPDEYLLVLISSGFFSSLFSIPGRREFQRIALSLHV